MSQIAIGFLFSIFTAKIVLIGDTVIKQAADQNDTILSRHVLMGVVLYGMSALFLFASMPYLTLATAGVAFAMISLISMAIGSAVWFGEPLVARDLAVIGCDLGAMMLMMRAA